MKEINIVEGLPIAPTQITEGSLVRVKFDDEVEPNGYYWGYAKCIKFNKELCLVQLDYNYNGKEEEIYPCKSYLGMYHVELLSKSNTCTG